MHIGDISKIDGAKIPFVDVVTGGSPCQDLSIAGKRAGLAGTRSGLFMEQIRIIKEMQEASGATCPRYMVWENVPGAFSSNKGKDFAAVLEETIRIVEPEAPNIEVPEKGWPTWGCYGRGMTLRTEVGKRLSLMREIPTKRLHEIADAEKDGRCIILPCKVGDKMQYMDDADSMGVEIVEKIVVEIETDSGIYSVDELGPEDFKSPQSSDNEEKEAFECPNEIKELSPRAQKLYSDLVTGKALYWEGEQDG